MALTLANKKVRKGQEANLDFVVLRVTFDSSYATGGESLTKANLGLAEVDFVQVSAVDGYVFQYDYTNEKILAYRTAAGATHTHALHFNNADVADGATTRVNVGTNLMGANTGADVAVAGVPDTTGAGGVVAAAAPAAAALAEVGSGVDLSAVTVRVFAVGSVA